MRHISRAYLDSKKTKKNGKKLETLNLEKDPILMC